MFPSPYSVEWLARVLGAEDAHGNQSITYADAESVPVIGWAPAGADQQAADDTRNAVVRDLDLFAEAFPGAPVDRVRINGVAYEQIGHPEDWRYGPFGFAPGVVVHLKRIEELG